MPISKNTIINCNRFEQITKTRCWSKDNSTGNLNKAEGATIFFIIKEAKKKTVLNLSKGTVKALWSCFVLIILLT